MLVGLAPASSSLAPVRAQQQARRPAAVLEQRRVRCLGVAAGRSLAAQQHSRQLVQEAQLQHHKGPRVALVGASCPPGSSNQLARSLLQAPGRLLQGSSLAAAKRGVGQLQLVGRSGAVGSRLAVHLLEVVASGGGLACDERGGSTVLLLC